MNPMRHTLIGLAIAAACGPVMATAGSETPPPGAPWQRDLGPAQREALRAGKPIFVYFTKTH
jgi:hypothetical protein